MMNATPCRSPRSSIFGSNMKFSYAITYYQGWVADKSAAFCEPHPEVTGKDATGKRRRGAYKATLIEVLVWWLLPDLLASIFNQYLNKH